MRETEVFHGLREVPDRYWIRIEFRLWIYNANLHPGSHRLLGLAKVAFKSEYRLSAYLCSSGLLKHSCCASCLSRIHHPALLGPWRTLQSDVK